MLPLEVDDVVSFLAKEEEEKTSALRAEESERVKQAEQSRAEEERKTEQLRSRRRQTVPQTEVQRVKAVERTDDSIYLGKQFEADQFLGAINRKVPESELSSQVKTIGDYYVAASAARSLGVAIVGSSGSGRSTTLKRLLDGLASLGSSLIVIDQKGEHRGIAWKYHWKTLGFAPDSQAQEFRVRMITQGQGTADLISDLLQEWCLQSNLQCTDQQRARIFSAIRSLQEGNAPDLTIESIVAKICEEPELAQLGQKLVKNLVGKGNLQRIFSKEATLDISSGSSLLLDISGRGLRDPTTKEERGMISVLVLRELLEMGTTNTTIVLEDTLDRFKSESLKRKVAEIIAKLKESGNTFIATARGSVREYVGIDCMEIVHRLSGEKAISEELQGFATDLSAKSLASAISLFPRGYAITSRLKAGESTYPSCAVRIDPLQFGPG
ncbi:MAG: helicase HerA domain-containing protein [Nitrososphaerales archaeon]